MKIFNPITTYFTKMVSPPSLEDIIANNLKQKQQVVINSDHIIRTHNFQKHMAEAEIEAMILWTCRERTQPKVERA